MSSLFSINVQILYNISVVLDTENYVDCCPDCHLSLCLLCVVVVVVVYVHSCCFQLLV